MKTIGIIGGIGSGKSTVVSYFKEHGIPVLDLDSVGHAILEYEEVQHALAKTFGKDILDSDGRINRKKLANKAFRSIEESEQLGVITAPKIIERMNLWKDEKESEGAPLAVVEASAYDGPQSTLGNFASFLIAVNAPLEVRVKRATKKGFDEDDVLRRIARQATDEERSEWADFVINNDGSRKELVRKLDEIWEELRK